MRILSPVRFVVCLLLLLCFARPASADEQARVKLVYVKGTDPTCPDVAELRDLVTSRLGYDPFQDDATKTITIAIALSGKGVLAGTVTMNTKRELVGREGACQELAQALAVAVAIALDPFGENKPAVAPVPVPQPIADPPEEPNPSPPTQPAPAKDPEVPSRIVLGLAAMSTAGLLPFPALGAGLRVDYGKGAFSVGAGGRILSTLGDIPVGNERISGSLVTGTLDGCTSFSIASACVVATAGRFAAEAATVTTPATQRAFYADLGARLGVRIPLVPRLSVEGFVEGRIPLTQTELYVGGATIFRSTIVTGTLGIGPVFQIY